MYRIKQIAETSLINRRMEAIMNYKQCDVKNFIENFNFFHEKILIDSVKRAYISVGSHLFINLGNEIESKFPNGRPCKKSQWTIWLGGSVGWRLSKKNKYITDSSEPYEEMNAKVQQLLGKKYLSSSIMSQFMDIQFDFEDGYQLTSFLKRVLREQWVLFCSNGHTVGLESEKKSQIEQIVALSEYFDIVDLFQFIDLPIDQKKVWGFSLEEGSLYLDFQDDLSLFLESCAWRIEKNGIYCIGSLDHFSDRIKEDASEYLNEIKGKKLIQSSVIPPFQDAKFEFENGYIIKTFSCYKNPTPWRIVKDNQKKVYLADISSLSNA